jgi:ssDNA-binding Zn-finger/Zn-ribbon topoisomerase 1
LAFLLRELESKPPDHGASPRAGKRIDAHLVAETNTCPECGSAMTRRTAKRGQFTGQDFLGCTRYPMCHGVRQVASLGSNS